MYKKVCHLLPEQLRLSSDPQVLILAVMLHVLAEQACCGVASTASISK